MFVQYLIPLKTSCLVELFNLAEHNQHLLVKYILFLILSHSSSKHMRMQMLFPGKGSRAGFFLTFLHYISWFFAKNRRSFDNKWFAKKQRCFRIGNAEASYLLFVLWRTLPGKWSNTEDHILRPNESISRAVLGFAQRGYMSEWPPESGSYWIQ